MVHTETYHQTPELFSRHDPTDSCITEDLEFYSRRFDEDSPRLFSSQDDCLKSLCIPISNYERAHEHTVKDIGSLNALLQHNANGLVSMLHFFQQHDSWSRFKITGKTCKKLLASHNVFFPFLDCLHSFGYKIEEDSRIWDGFQAKTSSPSGHLRYELCYTVRYFEKNNRGSGDPWSLRQTGIYQQVDMTSRRSIWIFLQAGHMLQERIRKTAMSDMGRRKWHQTDNLMELHKYFISTGLNTFTAYIEDLQVEVTELGYKAIFSSVGIKKRHDFILTFVDIQNLQALKQKLIRVSTILKYYEQLVKDLQRFVKFNSLPTKVGADYELDMCASQARTHARRVDTALAYLDGTADLLSKILVARQDEILIQSNKAMEITMTTMERIAFESREENKKLTEISVQNQRDSKVLKVLTLIATIYLPASLIATIFSSSLIQVAPINGSIEYGTKLTISKEFWVYVLITAILTGVTFLITHLITRPWKRRH